MPSTLGFSTGFIRDVSDEIRCGPVEKPPKISKHLYGFMVIFWNSNLKTMEVTVFLRWYRSLHHPESLLESLEKVEKINVENYGVELQFSHRLLRVFLQSPCGLWSFTVVICEIQFSYSHKRVKTPERFQSQPKKHEGTVTLTAAWNNNGNCGRLRVVLQQPGIPVDNRGSLGFLWEPSENHEISPSSDIITAHKEGLH